LLEQLEPSLEFLYDVGSIHFGEAAVNEENDGSRDGMSEEDHRLLGWT
jgi:hypothetical protein